METESASNEEENDEQSKRDHIQERLKEMGVSQDSDRPKKSWFSRNVNFLIISIVAILVGAFAIEYQSSKKIEADSLQVAEQNSNHNQTYSLEGNSYYQPANGMVGMEMQVPSWAPPNYRDPKAGSASGHTNEQQNSAANESYPNNNAAWYGQRGFYVEPQYQQYYEQTYQQPFVKNELRNQQNMNAQNQEQRRGYASRQWDYRGRYNKGRYNDGQYNDNGRPAYNPYYEPMPNPYSMPYPTAGYYNGWYR